MEINVTELTELNKMIHTSLEVAHRKGVEEEQNREVPETLFDSFLEYAKKSKTLIDYERNKETCWIQIKPTREGSKGTKHVEIGFEFNGMNVDSIGIGKS